MKYLDIEQLKQLSQEQLDDYSHKLMLEQMKLLELIDKWSDHYNIASDEYDRRKPKRYTFLINNESNTKH